VQKISTDLTGDPNVLLAGDTLRYTITAKNIGAAHAVNVALRDAIQRTPLTWRTRRR
jgi:uncharacterized repeat protein (TIGR01451 family)